MDTYKYTTILHDFLEKQGLLDIIVGKNKIRIDSLVRCSRLIANLNNIRIYETESVLAQSAMYSEEPIKDIPITERGIKPEEIIYSIVTHSDLSPRLRGIDVRWDEISDLWVKELSGQNIDHAPKKQHFKSIW